MITGGTIKVLILLSIYIYIFSIDREGKRWGEGGVKIEIYIGRYNREIKYIVSYFHRFCIFKRLSPD